MTLLARRWMRRTLIAVIVVATVLAASLWYVESTIPRDDISPLATGTLSVDSDITGSYKVGRLRITVSGTGMVIRARDRIVWRSPPKDPFLAAGRGSVAWQHDRGYKWPRTIRDQHWTDQSLDGVRVENGAARLTGMLDGRHRWTATIQPEATTVRLSAEVPGADSVALISGRSSGAGVHGFGEQFAPFDLSGRVIPIVTREQGVGRGEQPLTALANLTNHGAGGNSAMTYAAWPVFLTDDVRGVRLTPGAEGTDAFAIADMSHPRRVAIETWNDRFTADLTSADTPADVLSAWHHHDPPPPPDWLMSGAVVGLQGGTARVRDKLSRLRSAGAHISGVWLQDWSGQRTTSFGDRVWWTWQLDRKRYPQWEQLVSDLNRDGIHVTTYVNPYLVDPGSRSVDRNLFTEARDAGYLVRDVSGAPLLVDQGGFDAAMVDLSSPRARDWYSDVIAEEVLGAHVDGFMADFAEGPPSNAKLAGAQPAGGDAAGVDNRWPAWWARTVRQACRKAKKPDCAVWFRAASASSTRYAGLFWNGDQMVDYSSEDGLASALLGTFAAGVSGWPLVHSDVGGYTSVDAKITDYVRGPELLARWGEYAAFGVMMRTHETNRPDANRQVYDRHERRDFGRATRIYAALSAYRRAVVAEAITSGVPALRHGWLVAPGTAAAQSDRQIFLGDDVLMVPALDDGVREVSAVLPPGRWRHLITGRVYDGDRTVRVDAPVGRPAAFVRADSPWADGLTAAVQRAVRD